MRRGEKARIRRVADLALKCDYTGVAVSERDERFAVRAPRGDRFADRPVRGRVGILIVGDRGDRTLRLRGIDAQIAWAAQLVDRCLRIVERLAVEAVSVGN